MCAKSKVWKTYKSISGKDFKDYWDTLNDSERDEWHVEKQARQKPKKTKEDEPGSTEDK